jgi:hypothetical protein
MMLFIVLVILIHVSARYYDHHQALLAGGGFKQMPLLPYVYTTTLYYVLYIYIYQLVSYTR